MRKYIIAIGIIALSSSAAYAADKANFKDGLWEITSTMEMEGMAMGSQTNTVRQCMKSDNPIPARKDVNCKVDKMNISGDSVNWRMTCNDPQTGKVQTEGNMTYRGGESFDGKMDTKFSDGEHEMKMHSDMRGTYVGACPSK